MRERIVTDLPKLGGRLERIAKAFSDSSGVTVRFHSDKCCTDGKVITLPLRCANMAAENMDVVWAYVNHEAEHVRQEMLAENAIAAGVMIQADAAMSSQAKATSFARWAKEPTEAPSSVVPMMGSLRRAGHSYLAKWLNVMEDIRIERIAGDRFEGIRQHLHAGRAHLLEAWIERAEAEDGETHINDFVAAGLIFQSHGHDVSWLPSKAKAIIDGMPDVVGKLDSFHDAVNAAIIVAAYLKAVHDEASGPDVPAGDEGGGPDESSESPLEGLADAVKAGSGSAPHTPESEQVERHSSPLVVTSQDRLVADPIKPSDKGKLGEIRATTAVNAVVLASQMSAMLMAKGLAVKMREQPRGKLDRRSLSRLNRPGELPKRDIFCKKIPGAKLNTAVSVLIDCSGSMGGIKMTTARTAAALIGDTLVHLENLGVQWNMFGFLTDYDWYSRNRSLISVDDVRMCRLEPVIHQLVKGWDEDWRHTAPRVCHLDAEGQNADADSVRWAVHDNLKRKADRHIVLVLSDGSPCVSGDYRKQSESLRAAVKEATSLGVEIQGLGILDESVRHYYPVSEVINNIGELPRAVIAMSRKWFIQQ